MQGKTWEDIFLSIYKECKNRNDKIEFLIESLEEESLDLCDLEEYIKTYKKGIHIPKWTLLSDATPNDLEIFADHYQIFCEPDFFHEGRWNKENNYFEIFLDDRWLADNNVKYWMPIIYPEPY